MRSFQVQSANELILKSKLFLSVTENQRRLNNNIHLILCRSVLQQFDSTLFVKCFLLFTSLKTEAPLFSVTPQPRRWWVGWTSCQNWSCTHVWNPQTHSRGISLERAAVALAVFLSCTVFPEVQLLHTQSYKEGSNCHCDGEISIDRWWKFSSPDKTAHLHNSAHSSSADIKVCKPQGGNESARYSLFVCFKASS